jgi:hypothetical protein
MRQSLGGGVSKLTVLDQAVVDQVFALLGDVFKGRVVEVEGALDDVVDDLRLGAAWEWHLAAQHNVQYDTHRPDVNLLGVFLQENLWRDVVRRATHGRHGLLLREIFAETEINHLDASEVVGLVEHEVLRLDVSMRNVFAVKVVQG